MTVLNRFKSNWKIVTQYQWLDSYTQNKSYPICLEIDPSNYCPLNCSYCCCGKMRSDIKSMIPRKKLLNIVKQAKELGVRSLIWTGGGEPLSNPATIEAIQYSKKLGMENGMFTNAILLDKDKANILAKNLNWIRFHVGGSTAKTYSENHCVPEDYFRIACENIEYMAKISKDLCGIGVAINEKNFDGAKGLPFLAVGLGVEYFQAKLEFDRLKHDDYVDWWFKTVVPYFEMVEKELAGKVKIHYFNDPIVRKTEVEYCHAHRIITAITADGRVTFCKMRRDQVDTSIGNIYKNTLKQIFDSKRHKEVSAKICPKSCSILASFCPYRTTNEAVDENIKLKASLIGKHYNFF